MVCVRVGQENVMIEGLRRVRLSAACERRARAELTKIEKYVNTRGSFLGSFRVNAEVSTPRFGNECHDSTLAEYVRFSFVSSCINGVQQT